MEHIVSNLAVFLVFVFGYMAECVSVVHRRCSQTKKAREAKELEVAEKAEQNRLKQEKAAQLAREEQLKHEQELARKAQYVSRL